MYVLEYGVPSPDQITAVSADDPAGLVRALQSSNQFWRLTAQRLIVENQIQGLEADLVELVRQKELDATGFDAGAVHALWTLRGLNAEEALQSVAAEALTHPSAAVRKAVIETLPATDETGMLLVKHQLYHGRNAAPAPGGIAQDHRHRTTGSPIHSRCRPECDWRRRCLDYERTGKG